MVMDMFEALCSDLVSSGSLLSGLLPSIEGDSGGDGVASTLYAEPRGVVLSSMSSYGDLP